jgi:hypothetical protein
MTATPKTISGLVESQLPDFINADYPKFKRFIELYYTWLENNSANGISNTAGNTVYHAMGIENYRDIDQTPAEFVKYFKEELLPYFPENTALSTEKILKSAREFYSKKGSDESIRWLFKALFDEDIEITYPKEEILKTSDGKWIKPRAFRITVNEFNKNIDVNLLEKRLVYGTQSGATCIIESANRNIDPTNGREIMEIYISNIKKYFNNGELIEINYVDANGVSKVFNERIIGTLSNIRVDSNIRTDPQQRRRGLLYNIGDPVVITGGLGNSAEANDAAAIVGNVTLGSIEAVTMVFPGYGYRLYSNTETIVYRSAGDDPNANLSTDLRVLQLNSTACTSNSQRNFIESITYDKTVIDYLADTDIGNANYAAFTTNTRNSLINVTENDKDDGYNNYEEVWANGTNFFDALFTAKIATPNNTIFGMGGVSANTGDLLVYDVSNTGPLATVLTGAQINTRNTAKSFVFNSITNASVPANSNSMIVQCLDFDTVNTGGVALVSVLNGGAGFRAEPAIEITSHYDTHLSEQYSYASQKVLKKTYWQTFKDLGLIAHVFINNGGSGYSIGDGLRFSGRGYDANGYVQTVSGTGAITSVILDNRGEGYYSRPLITVQSSGGANAVFTGYLFGDGEEHTIETSAVGRIRDIRLIYRGYDYTATPNVSLKIVDTIINPIPEANTFTETEIIYQGASLATSTFRANVKSYDANTGLLRLYDFSGAINKTIDLITANGVYCNVNTAANVPAPAQYPSIVIATGLPNPMYYGNGRAKANAQFANGLIEFNGFFLNTDGFVSADKVLQDDTIYHNFSYVVQSEKNLVDFETPIKNIVHPSGLELISKTVIRSEEQAEIPVYANVDLIMPGNGTSNIQVSNSYSNVVIGNSTLFMPNVGSINYSNTRVNVGDLFIVIDSTRLPISRIVSNVVSNTQLEIYGDFIYAGQGLVKSNVSFTTLTGTAATTNDSNVIVGTGTSFNTQLAANNLIKVNNEIRQIITVTNAVHLVVNANLNFTSTAQTAHKLANTTLVVYGNTNGVYEMVQAGDNVSFNIAAANVMGAQTGTVQVFTTNAQVIGTSTAFLTQIKANDIVMINGHLKQVINIANNTMMNVNASFASNTSGILLYKRATSQNANVLSVSGNTMTLNIAYNANVSNLVYLVAPNLATEDLGFTVVTLTAY